MLDFYLFVSDYDASYGKSWMARANRMIPPNVFPFEHNGLIAKYAVLSEADFARLNSPAADNVSVWARFAQPSRLLWSADDLARQRSEEHTSELQSLMRISYAVFCLNKTNQQTYTLCNRH